MDPEEMDLVELLVPVAVEPSWRVGDKPELAPAQLDAGRRGMVIHRREQTPPLDDVEFVDEQTNEPRVLAVLRGEQIRVVERDTLSMA
ncbi:MAG TPA: hypothetical protein VJQ45_10875 [Ktedonobacterales bacterium]|nr:hypothetical protein [Ktedonobacterales bacterium]